MLETMLKIKKLETASELKLSLEGWLTWPWTADIGTYWQETLQVHPERKFVVDLSGVTRIDESGANALKTMQSKGARFLAQGVWIHHLLKILKSKGVEIICDPPPGSR